MPRVIVTRPAREAAHWVGLLAARGIPVSSVEAVILHGRPGTAMPAWKSLLTEDEAGWIARQLLQGFPEEAP